MKTKAIAFEQDRSTFNIGHSHTTRCHFNAPGACIPGAPSALVSPRKCAAPILGRGDSKLTLAYRLRKNRISVDQRLRAAAARLKTLCIMEGLP